MYAKEPFAGPQQMLLYLGKYTHRIAISNHRIIDIRDDTVLINWKDYKDSDCMKTMSLTTPCYYQVYEDPFLRPVEQSE